MNFQSSDENVIDDIITVMPQSPNWISNSKEKCMIYFKCEQEVTTLRWNIISGRLFISYFGANFLPSMGFMKENVVGEVISAILFTSYHHLWQWKRPISSQQSTNGLPKECRATISMMIFTKIFVVDCGRLLFSSRKHKCIQISTLLEV